MSKFDLIIRGGTIVDGTGAKAYVGDVALKNGQILQVGKVNGKAEEEIDANGMLVAPGFVDIHTHYDGQATWDQEMAPSSWHGVTTVVMGNCGVGFAPADVPALAASSSRQIRAIANSPRETNLADIENIYSAAMSY